MVNLAQQSALTLIRAYQLVLAPLFAGSCRYVPSCSVYASEAITRFGVIRGSGLALRRLSRCHPLGGHGIDPVPAFSPSEPPASRSTLSQTSIEGTPASKAERNQSL